MESFYAASNFTLDEDSSDNLSIKMNRSRLLLSEMGNETSTDHHHHNTSVSRHMLSSTTNLINSNSKTSSLFRKSLISTESPLLNRQQQQQRLLQSQQSRQSIEPEVNNTISSGVYAQFKLDSNKYIDEESNLIDLLASYSNICAENSQFLNERIQSLKLNRQKQELLNQTITEQEDLEKEKYLWNLIHLLYTDEQTRQDEEEDNDYEQQDKENNNSIGINEIMLEKRLLKQQPLLRRIKLVIEWLEKQASESKNLNSIRSKITEFSEKCTGWDHTLHHLKHAQTPSLNKKEKLTNLMSSREFVDELDPDAPLRQSKSLHDLDQEDEYKIMEYIYSFIRAGELNSARDFCFKIGQSWRAATLEGFKMFNDRNYFSSNGIDDQDMMTMMNDESTMMQQQQLNNQVYLNEGNFNRDIWRLMVQRLIKDDHFTPYEKASYASLGGFVSPILPVCRTYMDFIWAYFKALYHHILEKEIQQNMSQLREFSNVPYDNDEDYFFTGLNKTSSLACLPTVQQIFDRIKILINNSGVGSFANSNSNDVSGGGTGGTNQIVNNLKTDAQNPFSIILKYIILSGIDGFKTGTCEILDYLKTLITNNKQNGLILRFSAHLALFYKAASFQVKNETFIEINENYAQYLVDYNYKEIIAYYLSKLPNEIQIKRYSKFLQSISDNKERQHLLKLAKERNMNIQAITLNIVDNISRKSLTNGTPNRTINQTVAAAASSLSTTTTTTSVIMNKTTDQLFSIKKTNQLLTEEDKTRINAIDWIVYDSIQRFKLLEYANLTMRYFLLERENFEATNAIFSKIPADTISIILQQYNFNSTLGGGGGANINQLVENNLQLMLDNLPLNVTNTIKEYIGFKEYIEAVNIYNDWFEFYHREKPVKPMPKFDLDLAQTNQQQSGMDQSNIFAERIAYDYQLKQYQDLLTRWNSKAKIYCDKSRLKFYSLLKFPFLGWMVDIKQSESFNISDDDDDDDDDNESEEESGDAIMNEDGGDSVMTSTEPVNESKQRLKQMKNLRRVYLPNVCFVLIDMLSKMKLNKELIRVSDVVAAEHYKLYTLFDTKQIKCLLNKIADASIALLDEDSDLLGY